MDPITLAPIEYPSIKIGSTTYTLKYSTLAEYVADDLKLNIPEFFASLRDSSAGKFSAFLKLFSAMVAHNFVAIKQPIPTPEQWAQALDDMPDPARTAKVKEVCDAVGTCLRAKIQASAAVKLQEPTPALERTN